jgi:hypothetical protein
MHWLDKVKKCDLLPRGVASTAHNRCCTQALHRIRNLPGLTNHFSRAALLNVTPSSRQESRILPVDCSRIESPKITERSLDTVACQGNSVLDGLRADYRDSDNLVADDRDDLAGVAAR